MSAAPAIRQATARDADAVRALAVAAYAPWEAVMGQRPAPMDDAYDDRIAAGQVWVSGASQAPDGLLVMTTRDDAVMLDTVAVAPAAQGRGLGAALERFARAHATALGLRRVRLYTHRRMVSNQAWYRRLGYSEIPAFEPLGAFDRVYFERAL